MNKILIVVDIQNGFCQTNGTREVADKIIALTRNGSFDKVVATRFINKEESPFRKYLNWDKLSKNPDIDLVDGIKADEVVDKAVYTCVNNDFIDLLKKLNNDRVPNKVHVCGVDTDCCVLKIAVDLFEKGIMPIVLTEYCFSNAGIEMHKSGLDILNRLIGKKCLIGKIINAKEDID